MIRYQEFETVEKMNIWCDQHEGHFKIINIETFSFSDEVWYRLWYIKETYVNPGPGTGPE